MRTRRPIACVRLPELPIVAHHRDAGARPRAGRAGPDVAGDDAPPPRAVHRGRGTQARIAWCDSGARAHGVRPGMTVAAARARIGTLRSVEEDRHLLAEAHRDVVRRLLAVSPRITIDGPTHAWVEPVAAQGEHVRAWCDRAAGALAGLGPVALGVGPTATVAWAAARGIAEGSVVVGPDEARAFLDVQPLEALEIQGEALDVLAALGVRRVGELRAFDPVSLGMRFGPTVADARRRADGLDVRGPLTPRRDDDDDVRVHLDDELDSVAPLAFLLAAACDRLAGELRGRGLGAVALRLVLELRGGAERPVDVRTTSPLADARPMLELLRTELERLHLPAPIRAFRLAATSTTRHGPRSPSLGPPFGGPGRDDAAREVTLHRLRARLGPDAVREARPAEAGPPLLRARWRNLGTVLRNETSRPTSALPWRRLDPPAPVTRGFARIAGRCRRLVRIGRVERVTPPWWEDGRRRVELLAWAEMDGPLLVMLRALCDSSCDDVWEVIAWVD